MTDDTKLRDELAKDIAQFCWCAGGACSGCEENSIKLFKKGWDAKANHEDEKIKRLVDCLRDIRAASYSWVITKETGMIEAAVHAKYRKMAEEALKEFEK